MLPAHDPAPVIPIQRSGRGICFSSDSWLLTSGFCLSSPDFCLLPFAFFPCPIRRAAAYYHTTGRAEPLFDSEGPTHGRAGLPSRRKSFKELDELSTGLAPVVRFQSMVPELEGIYEKIKRADECISNLERESSAFFATSAYPDIPQDDDERFQTVLNYHRGRPIPIRFKVLAGEIAHHLRSSLDHLMWQLSSKSKRAEDPSGIEFPILAKKPSGKDEIARYNRRVEGLSAEAKVFVDQLQPYSEPRPHENPLFVIHEMDRVDKHRDLVIVFPSFRTELGPSAWRAFLLHQQARNDASLSALINTAKADSVITPQMAFGKIGGRKDQFVIPCLLELSGCVRLVVSHAGRLFK